MNKLSETMLDQLRYAGGVRCKISDYCPAPTRKALIARGLITLWGGITEKGRAVLAKEITHAK